MAYIVSIKILVDEVDENAVSEKLDSLLRAAKTGNQHGDEGSIVDWKIDEIAPINEDLEDSIVNETYEKGEAFEDQAEDAYPGCKVLGPDI
jgi:hypothetical protein